jgi:hypothetical protein
VKMTKFAISGDLSSTGPAISLSGTVFFSAELSTVSKWNGRVVESSAQGVFTWTGGRMVGCLDQFLLRFVGASASVTLSSVVMSFNSGSIFVANGVRLLVENGQFYNGIGSPYVMLGNCTAHLQNCTFASHSSSSCVSCGVETGTAGVANVLLTDW